MLKPVGKKWTLAVDRVQERLRDNSAWFPFPALIAALLTLILTAHLLPGINPRVGSEVNYFRLVTTPEKEGALWFGVYPKSDRIVVLTSDHHQFSWPRDTQSLNDLRPFVDYLQARTKQEAFKAGLSGEANAVRAMAVLAVDQALDYYHVRPLIYALAEARITRYGFETLNMN